MGPLSYVLAIGAVKGGGELARTPLGAMALAIGILLRVHETHALLRHR